MNIWMIIWSMGYIGGSIGPLPYDMDECKDRATAMNVDIADRVRTGVDTEGNPIPKEALAKANTLRFECVASDIRPAIGSGGA